MDNPEFVRYPLFRAGNLILTHAQACVMMRILEESNDPIAGHVVGLIKRELFNPDVPRTSGRCRTCRGIRQHLRIIGSWLSTF